MAKSTVSATLQVRLKIYTSDPSPENVERLIRKNLTYLDIKGGRSGDDGYIFERGPIKQFSTEED